MIEAIFVFTAAMTIMATIKMISIMFGHSIDMPGPFYGIPILALATPTMSYVLYPSLMFQIWFWANNLGVFT